jgi:RNA recognition motif-containing protein
MKIYVYNFPTTANEAALKELFSKWCKVSSVKIIIDYLSKKSKGSGFINVPVKTEAKMR